MRGRSSHPLPTEVGTGKAATALAWAHTRNNVNKLISEPLLAWRHRCSCAQGRCPGEAAREESSSPGRGREEGGEERKGGREEREGEGGGRSNQTSQLRDSQSPLSSNMSTQGTPPWRQQVWTEATSTGQRDPSLLHSGCSSWAITPMHLSPCLCDPVLPHPHPSFSPTPNNFLHTP